MKRFFAVCLLLPLLIGCGKENANVSNVIALRNQIMRSGQCSFTAEITADYGDSLYAFSMECTRDNSGDMKVVVTAPETISGISARIKEGTGQLTFEDTALMFELIADSQITPICGPWLFLESLTSGYINTVGDVEEGIRVRIDDSFSGVQFSVDVWLDQENTPKRAEIVWDGQRILSLDIIDFVML